ncbi:MAG: hypothetical protein NWE98_08085 [Candidatus Bathyarchaeota archaeon]|nr:hypothetical protein [Candidatus Bathyarchaeota archaeon]
MSMKHNLALLLSLTILISSLTIIKPTTAQISPSIPQFTLKFEDHSYNVAPTYTTDPNTGNMIKATDGYRKQIKFIDVIIKNPDTHSFYGVVNESIVKLYYNIRAKAHTQDWTNATTLNDNLAPSDADYTTIKFGIGQTNPDPNGWSIWLGDFAPGSQVDFQVQGINGFYTNLTETPPCWRLKDYNVFNETGRSPWSETQTITIPNDSSYLPTPRQTYLGFTTELIFGIIATATVTFCVSALIYYKKQRKQNPHKLNPNQRAINH